MNPDYLCWTWTPVTCVASFGGPVVISWMNKPLLCPDIVPGVCQVCSGVGGLPRRHGRLKKCLSRGLWSPNARVHLGPTPLGQKGYAMFLHWGRPDWCSIRLPSLSGLWNRGLQANSVWSRITHSSELMWKRVHVILLVRYACVRKFGEVFHVCLAGS